MGRQSIILLLVVALPVTICTASILRKTIHQDGRKDFIIAKQIKKNNCTCSCSCIPNDYYTKTTEDVFVKERHLDDSHHEEFREESETQHSDTPFATSTEEPFKTAENVDELHSVTKASDIASDEEHYSVYSKYERLQTTSPSEKQEIRDISSMRFLTGSEDTSAVPISSEMKVINESTDVIETSEVAKTDATTVNVLTSKAEATDIVMATTSQIDISKDITHNILPSTETHQESEKSQTKLADETENSKVTVSGATDFDNTATLSSTAAISDSVQKKQQSSDVHTSSIFTDFTHADVSTKSLLNETFEPVILHEINIQTASPVEHHITFPSERYIPTTIYYGKDEDRITAEPNDRIKFVEEAKTDLEVDRTNVTAKPLLSTEQEVTNATAESVTHEKGKERTPVVTENLIAFLGTVTSDTASAVNETEITGTGSGTILKDTTTTTKSLHTIIEETDATHEPSVMEQIAQESSESDQITKTPLSSDALDHTTSEGVKRFTEVQDNITNFTEAEQIRQNLTTDTSIFEGRVTGAAKLTTAEEKHPTTIPQTTIYGGTYNETERQVSDVLKKALHVPKEKDIKTLESGKIDVAQKATTSKQVSSTSSTSTNATAAFRAVEGKNAKVLPTDGGERLFVARKDIKDETKFADITESQKEIKEFKARKDDTKDIRINAFTEHDEKAQTTESTKTEDGVFKSKAEVTQKEDLEEQESWIFKKADVDTEDKQGTTRPPKLKLTELETEIKVTTKKHEELGDMGESASVVTKPDESLVDSTEIVKDKEKTETTGEIDAEVSSTKISESASTQKSTVSVPDITSLAISNVDLLLSFSDNETVSDGVADSTAAFAMTGKANKTDDEFPEDRILDQKEIVAHFSTEVPLMTSTKHETTVSSEEITQKNADVDLKPVGTTENKADTLELPNIETHQDSEPKQHFKSLSKAEVDHDLKKDETDNVTSKTSIETSTVEAEADSKAKPKAHLDTASRPKGVSKEIQKKEKSLKQKIVGDESFRIDLDEESDEFDPNEEIRRGWRKALEELRRKLRAYQQSLNAKNNRKNGSAKRGSKKGVITGGLDDDNHDDDKKEGHLYIIQLGIKDLKKPSPTNDFLTDEDANITDHETLEKETLSKDNVDPDSSEKQKALHFEERSGKSDKFIESELLKDSSSENHSILNRRKPLLEDSSMNPEPSSTSKQEDTIRTNKQLFIEPKTIHDSALLQKTDIESKDKLNVDFSIDEQPEVYSKNGESGDHFHWQHRESSVEEEVTRSSVIDSHVAETKFEEEHDESVLKEISDQKKEQHQLTSTTSESNSQDSEGHIDLAEANGLLDRWLQEEKARLEQARLLREEQVRLERMGGTDSSSNKERLEEITKRLEQLAEEERRQREQLERIKLAHITRNRNRNMDEIIATTQEMSDMSSLSDSQCEVIRKFARVFKMSDPIEWVRINCPFAQLYFPRASCSHIQHLFKSCFV